ncbi:MAG: hypothetical protein O2894_02040 [Planctomycetota bacterium]|nr:hypothetical protein [Planctomycetota bacterium]
MRTCTAIAALLLTLAASARAEDEAPVRQAVVVLDRGTAARTGHRTDASNALRIWLSLAGRGLDLRLVAAGVDAEGETVLDDVSPTKPGLEGLAREPTYDFRGPTDPRAALAEALDRAGEAPIDLVLLGPFGAAAGEDAKPRPALVDAIKRWNAEAPDGSRVLAVRMAPKALARLEGVRGLTATGRLIVGFGEPTVSTQPFSPFGQAATGMEARVRLLVDVLALEERVEHGSVLAATSDVPRDRVEVDATAGLHTFVLTRQPADGRDATLSFVRRSKDADVTWLVDRPRPLSFRWEALASEARLERTEGGPAAPFAALDVEVGAPKTVLLRLQRTLTGPPPAWRVAAAAGELPAGLTVEVGPEARLSTEIGESEVRITFSAQAGQPVAASGTLVLSAEGVETAATLPYEIRVRPGRVTLTCTVAPTALPVAAADTPSVLRLVPSNANVPPTLNVRATCDGGQEAWLTGLLRSPIGTVTRWDLTAPLVLDVDQERTLEFELDPDAPAELIWPCAVTLTPESTAGLEVEGEAVLVIDKRKPRIELGGPPPSYHVEDRTLRADGDFVLRLEPDGGDGEWLLELLKTPPTLRSRTGTIGWQAVPRGQGVWHVVPSGEWTGAEPTIFRDQEAYVEVEIDWALGSSPGTLEVPVVVPARWGKRGFVLVSLALMALLLALLVVGYMRTPPVKGVLLYTVEGLDSTVGRLDLAAVGRRTRLIVADDHGKLSVAKQGDAIARVRPTRVGGMLEYMDVTGQRERRLLVDGVSLRLGRHLVRFVYGRRAGDADAAPPAGEDLLGPEFNLESGRIDALGDPDT